MTEKGTPSLDPCVKILETMRPAIWAFHHNQYVSIHRNDLPGGKDTLYRLAQEEENLKGETISGTSPVQLAEKGTPWNPSDTIFPDHFGAIK